MKKFSLFLLVVGAVVVSGALFVMGSAVRGVSFPVRQIVLTDSKGAEHVLKVEVADNDRAREQGLMFRSRVTRGMLFPFDRAQVLSFWMKNTLVPLDIFFFADDGSFVSAARMPPCAADPCLMYSSLVPAQYALEMPQGYAEKNRVGSGWTLRVLR